MGAQLPGGVMAVRLWMLFWTRGHLQLSQVCVLL